MYQKTKAAKIKLAATIAPFLVVEGVVVVVVVAVAGAGAGAGFAVVVAAASA